LHCPAAFSLSTKGLLLAADNESELAGVMAHEIAHVAARHAMENQGKGTLMNYGMLAGMIFGGPIVGTVLQNGGGILGGLAMLKFSRGAEEEADRLGVQYLYAAGYDPTGMSTMFRKAERQEQQKARCRRETICLASAVDRSSRYEPRACFPLPGA
jgi:predicted Zn-dependent protease